MAEPPRPGPEHAYPPPAGASARGGLGASAPPEQPTRTTVLEAWPWPTLSEPEPTAPPPAPRRPTRERRRGVPAGVVAVVALVSLLLGTLLGLVLAPRFGIETPGAQATPPPTKAPPTLVTPSPAPPGSATGLTDVSAIAATALASSVSIEVRTADGGSSGSGFVLREDGHILTNAHVVGGGAADGAQVVVVFSDGEQAEAQVVGTTADYDLAVLKVDRTGLVPLPLGDSDQVVVGQTVVAVGAPLGLQGTVTSGIVSALNRPVQAGDAEQTSFMNAIQTDAAINPGNSGGPLLNAAGEVIGINSAIAQPPGQAASGSIGLGFAIPSNQARRTAEELIANGFATYPVIGVLLDSGYTGVGVKVAEQPSNGTVPVTPGGPAEAAGIAPGDVIVAIDDQPVTHPDELIVAIRARAPGDTITLVVREDTGDRPVQVVLGEERS